MIILVPEVTEPQTFCRIFFSSLSRLLLNMTLGFESVTEKEMSLNSNECMLTD